MVVTQCTMQVQRNTVVEGGKKANLQLKSQLLPVIQPGAPEFQREATKSTTFAYLHTLQLIRNISIGLQLLFYNKILKIKSTVRIYDLLKC